MILVLNLKSIALIGLWSNDSVSNILLHWWKKKRSRNSKRSIVNYNTINGKFKSRKKFRDPALKKTLHETEEKWNKDVYLVRETANC